MLMIKIDKVRLHCLYITPDSGCSRNFCCEIPVPSTPKSLSTAAIAWVQSNSVVFTDPNRFYCLQQAIEKVRLDACRTIVFFSLFFSPWLSGLLWRPLKPTTGIQPAIVRSPLLDKGPSAVLATTSTRIPRSMLSIMKEEMTMKTSKNQHIISSWAFYKEAGQETIKTASMTSSPPQCPGAQIQFPHDPSLQWIKMDQIFENQALTDHVAAVGHFIQ